MDDITYFNNILVTDDQDSVDPLNSALLENFLEIFMEFFGTVRTMKL